MDATKSNTGVDSNTFEANTCSACVTACIKSSIVFGSSLTVGILKVTFPFGFSDKDLVI